MHQKRLAKPNARRPRLRHKENDALVAAAWEAGWWCELSKKGYIKCYPPNGKEMILIEKTPSDHHSPNNSRSRLRRAGLKI